jgi:hypothetical protein
MKSRGLPECGGGRGAAIKISSTVAANEESASSGNLFL